MKRILFAVAIGMLLISFGCVSNENKGSPNETKLEVNEGIGVLKDQIKVDDLYPGGEGFLSFTVRDNLGGVTAKDIIIGLENLGPFKIIECGGTHNATEIRNCGGIWDLDKGLPYAKRGTKFMIPGTEKNFWWRLKAPSANEIGYITLTYPIYYFTEYTYWTTNAQTVVFMSQNELIRRKEANEETEISGKSKLSAGEISVEFVTPQPIIYFYNEGQQQPYDFTAVYSIKNDGNGYPISDLLLVVDLPNGINYTSSLSDYGWKLVKDKDCKLKFFDSKTFEEKDENCTDVLKYALGNGYSNIKGDIDKGKVIARVISRNDITSQEYKAPCELEITRDEMNSMYQSNIPMKLFTFQTFVVYRYYKEGSVNINVYPLRV